MKKVSLWNIFLTFAKIGTFTIGGGYMMVPAIQSEISKKAWIKDEELPDIVALSQSAPGLLTVNMSIFTGYRIRGFWGSVVATFGCIVPPFIIILLIAMFIGNFRDNTIVNSIFMGVRPVAVAIIAGYTLKLCKGNKGKWWAWALSIITMIMVAFLKVSPVYILLVCIVLAVGLTWWREKK